VISDRERDVRAVNDLLLDSIHYAQRIQTSLLPDLGRLDGLVAEIGVIWTPRDIVGGDLYWTGAVGQQVVLVLADCTGHGVPGAFMTMIVASVLNRVLQESASLSPVEMLTALDRQVRSVLQQDRGKGSSDDGLDAAVVVYDRAKGRLAYAGARIPLIYRSPDGLRLVEASRRSLGYRQHRAPAPLVGHDMAVAPGTVVYLASDGVADTVAPDGRLFGRRRLLQLVDAQSGVAVSAQLDVIAARLADWRQTEQSRDDLTLLAARLS
jgi:serine phosphatase RsbU (regulator of sigma subunit)